MLNRTRLAPARVKRTLNEIESVRAHLPEEVLRVLALEVVQRVAAHPRRHLNEDMGPSEDEIARLCTALLSPDASRPDALAVVDVDPQHLAQQLADVQRPSIYVTYNDAQVYPDILIKFSQ